MDGFGSALVSALVSVLVSVLALVSDDPLPFASDFLELDLEEE